MRADAHRSAVYSGAISGRGPRYCPSIEDKVVRFSDRESHQIFLEPEGVDDPLIYPNGISTSLPEETQRALVATIPGLERARIVRPGYAIEYDYIDPRGLDPTPGGAPARRAYSSPARSMERPATRKRPRRGCSPESTPRARPAASRWRRFDRADSYLGVMVDDLTTHGVSEPYRMFTSRAEYRLSLRADNADERLTEKGVALGCVGAERADRLPPHAGPPWSMPARCFARRQRPRPCSRRMASRSTRTACAAPPSNWRRNRNFRLRRSRGCGPNWPASRRSLVPRLEADAKYAVYLDRQAEDVARYRREDAMALPDDLDYRSISGLSTELREKFATVRPRSLGQAGRIEGMTPAALALVAAHARRALAPEHRPRPRSTFGHEQPPFGAL